MHHMKHSIYSFLLVFLLSGSLESVSQTIYVSPSGNDQNEGTAVRPFAGLVGASNRLRELWKRSPWHHAEVIVRKGKYRMLERLVLGAADSGIKY